MHLRTTLLLGSALLIGCQSGDRKPPYADNPALLHYRPPINDSTTVLAEQASRLTPTRPPMPQQPVQKLPDPMPVPRSSPRIDALPSVKADDIVVPAREQLVAAPVAAKVEDKLAEPPPAPVIPVKAEVPAAPIAERKTVAGHYGFDPDRRWLQGVVERHYRGYWELRYRDPSEDDPHGGKVRLDPATKMGEYQNGDVVAVRGELIAGDERTPTYRVKEMWLVQRSTSEATRP